MTTDTVKAIKDYQAWVLQQSFDPDPTGPESYGEYLETQKELRILKAVRHYFADDNGIDCEYVLRLLDGEEGALIEEEVNYET